MKKKQSLSNSRKSKLGVVALIIASIVMLSFIATSKAVVKDLTPDYRPAGSLIDVLSWEIYGPPGGTNLTQIQFKYNGTDPADMNYTQFYANGTLLKTVYQEGVVIFLPVYEIDDGDHVNITMKIKIHDDGQDGNHVDGYIVNYVLTTPGGSGTDVIPADPAGYTIIDNIPPTLTKDLDGTMGLDGWYTTDVLVTLTGGDTGGSGLDKVEYNLNGGGWVTYEGPFTISTEGVNTLAHRVYDNAGFEYVLPTQEIKIDKTAPTLTKDLDGTEGDEPWWVSDVTVTLNAGDTGGSGLDTVEYSYDGTTWVTYTGAFVISDAGTTTLYHRVNDTAGNEYVLTTQEIKIDKIDPTLTKDLDGTQGNTPWWVSDVLVTLTGGDTGGSGLDKVEYNLNGGGWVTYVGPFMISDEGVNTLAHRVYDNAGRMYVLPTQEIKIDTIAPTVDDIAVSDDFIKESDVPGPFYVTVTFSEPMNPAVIPTIVFDPDVSTTLVNEIGAWSVGDTVYTFTYDIVDADVVVNDVDVTVGGAEDVAGNPDPLTGFDLFDIDTLHHEGVPEYIDVWAEYSAPMSLALNANFVFWPEEGAYSEWNSPEKALASDDEYAFITNSDGPEEEIFLVLDFEDPPEAVGEYEITSVILHVEQMLIPDFWDMWEDWWVFDIDSDIGGPTSEIMLERQGTNTEQELVIDITEAIDDIYEVCWEYLSEIYVDIYPASDDSPLAEWYVDNVWIEVNYIYHDEGPSITVPVGGEADVYANVTDGFNNTVPDGTEIHFETDIGTMYPLTDLTVDGIAESTIISTDVGTATVNASGSTNGVCYVNFVAHTLEIELSPGWNLVSVPRELENSTIEAVFDGITSITKVYTYQDGDWAAAFYDGGAWVTPVSLDPIDDVDDGKGYWVYASEPTTVTMQLEPRGYVDGIPPDYPLSAGWTLIGYTSLQLEPEMPVPVYLTNLDGIWQSLYSYSPAVGYDQAKPNYGFENTELSRGYWIYLSEAGVLVP